MARSQTHAAMLNPALLAAVTANAAMQYERERQEPMPWPLAFLVAPLVLHKGTRDVLPRTTATHLSTWIANNPTVHAGFAPRAAQLRTTVLEGIRFGLRYDALSATDEGALRGHLSGGVVDDRGKARLLARARAAGEDRIVAVLAEGTDLGQIVTRAGLVGRWMTKLESPATAFVMLGVRP